MREKPVRQAARCHGQKDIRIEDRPEPLLRPDSVAIDIAWCGICGTDLHEYLEGPIFIPSAGHPHPLTGEEEPFIMGHEFSGRITALGDLGYRDELIQRFELDPSKKVRAYSKGNRQKVPLVAALMTRADLLLLDEPASGLDPLMEQVFASASGRRGRPGRPFCCPRTS